MLKGQVFYPLIHLPSSLSCFKMKPGVVIIRPETTPWQTGTLLEATGLLLMSYGFRMSSSMGVGVKGFETFSQRWQQRSRAISGKLGCPCQCLGS